MAPGQGSKRKPQLSPAARDCRQSDAFSVLLAERRRCSGLSPAKSKVRRVHRGGTTGLAVPRVFGPPIGTSATSSAIAVSVEDGLPRQSSDSAPSTISSSSIAAPIPGIVRPCLLGSRMDGVHKECAVSSAEDRVLLLHGEQSIPSGVVFNGTPPSTIGDARPRLLQSLLGDLDGDRASTMVESSVVPGLGDEIVRSRAVPVGEVSTTAVRPPTVRRKRARVSMVDAVEETTGDSYSDAELLQMDADLAFVVPNANDLQGIKERAVRSLDEANKEELPCAVCELGFVACKLARLILTHTLLQNMRKCLAVREASEIPDFILRQYDASCKDHRLAGLLLCPGGVLIDDGEPRLTKILICARCETGLMQRKATASPPPESIANGNFIGRLPSQFDGLTRTDEQAIALDLPCVSMSTVTGGPCRAIRSHHYVVHNTGGPVACMLPRDTSSAVRVTMVGSMTPLQAALCKKRYRLNVGLCYRVLDFLFDNNLEYKATRVELRARDGADAAEPSFGPTIVDRTVHADEATPEQSAMERNVRDDSTYANHATNVDSEVDPALETQWISASSVMLQRPSDSRLVRYAVDHSQADTDLLVRKSNNFASLEAWAVVTRMFPMLFPGGCGGPEEPRRQRLSTTRWIKRCLRVHGHRFEQHYAFLLLAFDFLAMQEARRALYIKMHVSTRALDAGSIMPATVTAALRYYDTLVRARAQGTRPPPQPRCIRQVFDLRRGLRIPEGSFYGSNASRMRARHHLFGMLKRLGPMQIFFTVSPDASQTYSIALKEGSLASETVSSANMQLLPNRAERRVIAANNPMECATYFCRIMDTVIDMLLGWDQAGGKPRRGGGIFGVVRAYAAAAETQQSGNLHAHFCVWLYGFPTTSLAMGDELDTNPDFQRRVVALIDTVVQTTLPCTLKNSTCPVCLQPDSLRARAPSIEAFQRPRQGASPCTTAICTTCERTFGDHDIINASIDGMASRQHVALTAPFLEFEKCRPATTCGDALSTSIVARAVQVHFWSHSRSCFKVTTRTPKGYVCRFLKPNAPHAGPTEIDSGGRLLLRRPIGDEYVNPFNSTVMSVLKCNHDVQFLLEAGGRSAAAYVCKYCFKRQNQVENETALALAAFAKANASADRLGPDATPMERGRRLLGSMLYSLTNGQEVAATMAALHIQRKSPFWFSLGSVYMDVNSVLKVRDAETEEIEVRAPTARSNINAETTCSRSPCTVRLRQYWRRHSSLEDVSFVDICEYYSPVASVTARSDNSPNADHPGPDPTVRFRKTGARKVLVVSGRDIPDISATSINDDIDFYYRALLTLFKPHREATLLVSNRTAVEEYTAFVNTAEARIVDPMLDFEQHYKDFYKAGRTEPATDAETAEDAILRMHQHEDERCDRGGFVPFVGSDVDELSEDDYFDDGTDGDAFLANSEALVTAAEAKTLNKALEDAQDIVEGIDNLTSAVESVVKCYSAGDVVRADHAFNVHDYLKLNAAATPPTNNNNADGTYNFIVDFPDAETRLEILQDCFQPVPWVAPTSSPRWFRDALPRFPSIGMVSEAFSLNFWQHVAFEVYARHLLHRYASDIADVLTEPLVPEGCTAQPYETKQQLIGYLGGEAGTGKSTVVHALLSFADAWGRTGSVETRAFTGIAAVNIRGRTMHSARNLQLNGAAPKGIPSLEMRANFSRVVLVIADEVSMIDQCVLGGTDSSSRTMASNPDMPMGGKHMLMIGDYLQLPPVGGSPCYVAPPEHASVLRQAGFDLYNRLNFVVFLTENMRAKHDEAFAGILAALRWGRLLDGDIDKLNARVAGGPRAGFPSDSSRHGAVGNFYRPVVVSTNKLRCAINRDMTFQFARGLQAPVFECVAVASARSVDLVRSIENVNDDLTDRIPMKLHMSIGMPAMITRKHPQMANHTVIANGTLCTVVGFIPSVEECRFISTVVKGVMVKRFERLPQLVLLKVHGCNRHFAPDLPCGVIGLPPLHAQVRLDRLRGLGRASVTVDQFALVPAFSCTTEKLQGQTCKDGIIVTPLVRRNAVPPQTLYVALSRATTLANVTLTEPVTTDYLAKFRPSAHTTREMDRLVGIVELPGYASEQQRSAFDTWKMSQSA